MNYLEQLESQNSHIENIKNQVFTAKKVQLHTGMEGFDSPSAYGIYKNTGGGCLGVVGETFEPMDLKLFLDAIHNSILSSGVDVDMSKLEYNEYYGGSKVSFRIPLKRYEVKSKMVGDVTDTYIDFRTGFDGKTKMSLGFYAYRLFCSNGCGNWQKDVDLSMKNTTNNQAKVITFTNEIMKVVSMTNNYVDLLNNATMKKIKQSDIDKFLTELTGYNVSEYKELNTRKRNILDSINQNIAIEMNNTGDNLYSLLQGITRYTTHEMAEGNEEKILYAKAGDMNTIAHRLVYAEMN